MPDESLAAQARQWALDIHRYRRKEESQGQISPTDAAFLSRLQDFLSARVAPALEKTN